MDQRHAGVRPAVEDRARVRQRELAVVGAAQRAGPRVEDLDRLRAGFDLRPHVVGDQSRRDGRTAGATPAAART